MKCPVCDLPIVNHTKSHINRILIEEEAHCEDQEHSYHYLYFAGDKRERFGTISIVETSAESISRKQLTRQQRKTIVLMEREHYHSRKKKGETV